MSFRNISKHIKDMYDTDISHSTLSAITDKISANTRLTASAKPFRINAGDQDILYPAILAIDPNGSSNAGWA